MGGQNELMSKQKKEAFKKITGNIICLRQKQVTPQEI
jgi:hypothetical protein